MHTRRQEGAEAIVKAEALPPIQDLTTRSNTGLLKGYRVSRLADVLFSQPLRMSATAK